MAGESQQKSISVIIPVYREAEGIGDFIRTLEKIKSADQVLEWFFVDGGSPDDTVEIIRSFGIEPLISPKKGRAAQMNYGIEKASGDVLYFLHADTIPPDNFLPKILKAIDSGAESGCFRLTFDEPNPIMKLYSWFTRFDLLPFRFGDQSLFVTRQAVEECGLYLEDHIVMEDNEYIRRLRKRGTFQILESEVVTSARKYRENGFIRLQLIFSAIFLMYYAGADQDTLVKFYTDMIR